MKVLVTLGFFDASGEGRLVEVDLERGAQETRLAYTPPEELRVAEKGFTGAAWRGAALLDARWPPRAVEPTFADAPAADYYSPRDALVDLPFARRKVRDYSHPNHVAVHAGRLLVTRLLDRAVDDVIPFRSVIVGTPGLPHDGIVEGDRFWITCVNGLVVAYAIEGGRVTGREVERVDVFATGHTGWCRGLAVTSDQLVVGLTAIRRMPRHRWCDRPFEETETSVLSVERATGRLASRVELDERARHPKIFTILGR